MIVIISHPEKSSAFPIETKEHSINRHPKLGKSIIREQVAYKEGLKVDCKKLLNDMQEVVERIVAGHY